jgi:Protein of unknown function (DUF3185)
MNKIMPIAFLALGAAFLAFSILLIVHGIHPVGSVSSSFVRFLAGAPVDKSIWLLVGGLVLAACGVEALLRRPYSR